MSSNTQEVRQVKLVELTDIEDLSGRLVRIFNLFPENAMQIIDEAVAQAKSQIAQKAMQSKQNDLEKLFDTQVATFKDRGVPEQIVEILQGKRGMVVKRGLEWWENKYPTETIDGLVAKGIYISLPVIPRSYRSPYDLMAMVRNGGKVGYTYLDPTQIYDVVDAPQEPYYIYDVEDGNSTRDKSPENAEKTFKQQKRSPLTAAEVMALTVHTDVLSKHYVWAPGSRCDSADRVPYVGLVDGDRPKLDWFFVGLSHDLWGSASCSPR